MRRQEPLAHFGQAWLGYDAERGGPARFLAVAGLPAYRHLEIVDEPRRFGSHGTLKAPFRLAEGIGERELLRSVRACMRYLVEGYLYRARDSPEDGQVTNAGLLQE